MWSASADSFKLMVCSKLNHMEISAASNIFHIWNNLMTDWFNFSLLVNSNVTKVIKFIIMEGWLYENELLFAFSNLSVPMISSIESDQINGDPINYRDKLGR